MARRKVELEFIVNAAKRKAALKKRKKGIMKKVYELSTLCGVDACAIIYSPNDSQPEIWPSPWGVQRVLTKFKGLPELEQSNKMVNQESYLKQRLLKAKEQLKKESNDNRKKEMTLRMFQYINEGQVPDSVTMVDLNDLSWLIDQNLKDIHWRMTRSQAQGEEEAAPMMIADGAAMDGGKAPMDHGQGLDLEGMQKNDHWSVDLINGGGDETLPFADVNFQNGF